MKMVLIEWVDSTAVGDWTGDDDVELAKCRTMGFLLQKNKDRVVVAQSTSDIAHYDNRFGIPRGCIRSIKTLHCDKSNG